MLTKMTIENFKSFKNQTTMDFVATQYKILQEKNVNNNGILKGAIFVGGNAAGKTNIIQAIKVLLDLLFREKQFNMAMYKCLFSQNGVIKLNYEFNIENNDIKYSIEYDVYNKELFEKLYVNQDIYLERMGETGKSYITQNENFSGLDNEVLLLRTIYFNTKFAGYDVLKKWFEYLNNSIYIDASARVMRGLGKEIELNSYLEENGTEKINSFFNDHAFAYQIEFADKIRGNTIEFDNEGEKSIFFKREEIGEPIPYMLESLGNKNLINLLPAFFKVIQNGGMLIIDEFSSAFHNELEELLIKFFMNSAVSSQIFLVSHSTNLLSNTIFRPDQEYAVEFLGSNGSAVNRFSNEKPREAQNIEKMYTSGCFGGKPEYING